MISTHMKSNKALWYNIGDGSMNDGDIKCSNCGKTWTIYKANHVTMTINDCNELYNTKSCKKGKK